MFVYERIELYAFDTLIENDRIPCVQIRDVLSHFIRIFNLSF